MTKVRLKYLHCFTDRHGRARYYFRHRGRQWPLPSPGMPGFAAEYEMHLAQTQAEPTPTIGRKIALMPGSLGDTIERFLASPGYHNRADTTKRNYRRVLDALKQKYGTGLLRDLNPRHVRRIRNEMSAVSSTGSDIALSLLSLLWEFAIEELDLDLDANPTHGIKRIHRTVNEHQPWPPELIERFLREARSSLRFAVILALYTGQRRSDLVKMKWSDFDGEFIRVRQQKTGVILSVPCHKLLRAELESMPRVAETILVGEYGAPLKSDSLSVMVRKQLKKMGVDGYAIHGLRKNAAVALTDAGCSTFEIMAITGHQTLGMVEHYTKGRNQRLHARSAMDKWEAGGKPKNAG